MISYIQEYSDSLRKAIRDSAGEGEEIKVSPVLHTFLFPERAETGIMSGYKIRSSLALSRISATSIGSLMQLPIPKEFAELKAFEQEVVLRVIDLTNECSRSVLHGKTHSIRSYGPYHTTTIHVGATMQFVATSKTKTKVSNQSLATQQQDFATYLKHIGAASSTLNRNFDIILPYFYVRERIMCALALTGMEIEE